MLTSVPQIQYNHPGLPWVRLWALKTADQIPVEGGPGQTRTVAAPFFPAFPGTPV